MPPSRRVALALVAGAFVALQMALLAGAPAFVASDETIAYLVARGVLETGRPGHAIPFAREFGGGAFSPMDGYNDGLSLAPLQSPFLSYALAVPAALGVPAALAAMVAVGALLVLGAAVLARELLGEGAPSAGTVAAVALASSPAILFFSSLFFGNVLVLAAAVWGLALAARGERTRARRWRVAGWCLLGAAVALRLDAGVFLLPALALALPRRGRRAGWALLALAGVGVAYVAALSLTSQGGGAAPGGALSFIHDNRAAPSLDVVARNAREHVLGASPVLALVGGLGAVLLPRAANARAVAGLYAAGLAAAAFFLTWDLHGGQDPPGLFSSIVRYTLLLPLLFALGVAALLAALGARLGRPGRAAAVVVAACVAGAGLAQGLLAEPGALWLRDAREWRAAVAADALALPPEAIVVGDEASKFVLDRPILVPGHVARLDGGVDRLRASVRALEDAGRPVYVHASTYKADWSGPVGDYLDDGRHFATGPDPEGFLRLVRTNSSLRNVGVLEHGAWDLDAEGLCRSLEPVSSFRPIPSLADDLVEAPSPAFVLRVVVRDDDAAVHRLGHVNAPGTVNDLRVLHEWRGAGTGEWRVEEVFVPPDAVVNGPFFASGGLTFKEIHLLPMPGVVEP